MKTIFDFKIPKALSAAFIALSLLAICFTSCKKGDNPVTVSAFLRVTNAAEASSPQDFFVDNQPTASAIAYGQSSSYFSVGTGNHQGQFRTSGSSAVNSTVSLLFAGNTYYSVFYTDDKSTVSTTDDHTAPQSGNARVRFINLSSGLNSSVDFGASAGSKIVSGLAYKAASTYYEINAATAFSLYLSGSSSVLLSIPASLQAGHIYTIYISGATQATVTYHIVAES